MLFVSYTENFTGGLMWCTVMHAWSTLIVILITSNHASRHTVWMVSYCSPCRQRSLHILSMPPFLALQLAHLPSWCRLVQKFEVYTTVLYLMRSYKSAVVVNSMQLYFILQDSSLHHIWYEAGCVTMTCGSQFPLNCESSLSLTKQWCHPCAYMVTTCHATLRCSRSEC